MPNQHDPERPRDPNGPWEPREPREPGGHANGSQIINQIVSLLERLKDLYPPIEVPPHHPDWDGPHINQLAKRLGMGLLAPVRRGGDHGGEGPIGPHNPQAIADAAAKERAERQQRNDLNRAAMSGDLYAIQTELGDTEFEKKALFCLAPVGIATLAGPQAAIGALIANPNCLEAFIESYRRTVAQVLSAMEEHARQEARERIERMDRVNVELERYEEWSRTA